MENREQSPLRLCRVRDGARRLTDGEEGNVLEVELGHMVSKPHLGTNECLSPELTHKDSTR